MSPTSDPLATDNLSVTRLVLSAVSGDNSHGCVVGGGVVHYTSTARTAGATCFKWLCSTSTLRASLSGTILQTRPEMVTPPKGHFLSPRSSCCPPTLLAPAERLALISLWKQHSVQARPPRKKERVPSRFRRFWFYVCLLPGNLSS